MPTQDVLFGGGAVPPRSAPPPGRALSRGRCAEAAARRGAGGGPRRAGGAAEQMAPAGGRPFGDRSTFLRAYVADGREEGTTSSPRGRPGAGAEPRPGPRRGERGGPDASAQPWGGGTTTHCTCYSPLRAARMGLVPFYSWKTEVQEGTDTVSRPRTRTMTPAGVLGSKGGPLRPPPKGPIKKQGTF